MIGRNVFNKILLSSLALLLIPNGIGLTHKDTSRGGDTRRLKKYRENKYDYMKKSELSSFLDTTDCEPVPVEENLFSRVTFREFCHEFDHFHQSEFRFLPVAMQDFYSFQQKKMPKRYNKFGKLPSGRQ